MGRPTITMQQAVKDFLTVRSDLSPNTRRSVASALAALLKTTGKTLAVRSLTPKHLETHFLTGPLARKKVLASSTYNRERLCIVQFLTFCQNRGLITTNLMFNVRPAKVSPRKSVYLSASELVFLLDDQDHPRDRMIVAMGMNTALRASEIASLKVKDVDLEQGWLYTTLHKNNKIDVFPITSELDAELRRWLSWYAAKMGSLSPDWFLVPARVRAKLQRLPDGRVRAVAEPQGDIVPTRNCLGVIRRPLHRSLVKLGYDPHQEGLHTLRRSVARLYYDMLVEAGNDDALRVTQQLLNHSSVVVTEKYLGVERERRVRDESLRGKPFLSALVQADNVIHLGANNVNSAGA